MAPKPKRARNTPGAGSRLRQELIEAAGRVLATSPSGRELSLRAVAWEAGVAAPSDYLQFADKADLIGAVLSPNVELLRQTIEDAMARETEATARLHAGNLTSCRFGLDHPGAYRVLFEYELHGDRDLGPFGDPEDASAKACQVLVDAIGDCFAAGVAPPGAAFHQATLVWSGMHGYLTLVRVLHGFPWQPVEEHLDDLIVSIVGLPRRQPHIARTAVPDRLSATDGRSTRYPGGDDV